MKRRLAITALGWLALLVGCRVGPDYQRPAAIPSAELPASLAPVTVPADQLGDWKTAEPSAPHAHDAWWNVFGDLELDRLESLARQGSPSLAAAMARVDQARAITGVARAGLFPQVAAGASAVRQRTSENEPQQGHAAGRSHTFETFNAPLDLSWELDLWGRVRRQTEAARARFGAAVDDLEAVRLSVQAEIAANYFNLRAVEAETRMLSETLDAYSRSAELVRQRRKGGVASDLDVAQAETQLRVLEAQLPARRLEATRLHHALAALCGVAPPQLPWPTTAPGTTPAPPEIPEVVPSELLERRPDVAAAERRVAAANADIGVAQGAFYPRVRLNARAGFESVDAGTFFDWPSRLWAIGPSVDVPVFTAGRNRSQWQATRAAYDEAVAKYRIVVLTAFQEVADHLAAQRLLAQQLDAERSALTAARRMLELANNRYRSGLVTYLEVATAQGVAFARESAVVRLQGQRLVLATALVKALGGGWPAPN